MLDQSEANYRWLKGQLADLVVMHRGRHALLRNRAVEEYFVTSIEAIKAGLSRHGEGNFSVELIDDAVEDLGFYSHVGSTLRA
ncbi:MAG: hypothetical protein ACKOPG_12035 [Novosphingobium sp.]